MFIGRLVYFLSKKGEEIVVLPFDINTSKKTYTGSIISNSLVVELRNIKEIHNRKFEEEGITCEKISLPMLAPNTEQLETTVSNLGNINVAGMTLSMGGLLTVLKRLWPLGGQAITIKGSLQESDSEIHLIALMEGPSARGWDRVIKIKKWTNEDKIPELIKDLAFMITYDLSKQDITAKTWTSLRYFTEALDSYSQYIVTKKPDYLENALKNCIKASQEEKDYQILFNLFYNLGLSYYDIKDYHSVEDAFRRCITLMPNNENGFVGLGAALSGLGRHEDALKALDKALEINPEDAYAWYNKGYALNDLGRYEDALKAFDKALEVNPEDAYAWNNKGYALSGLGQNEDALKAFEKSLEIDPEDAYAWNNKVNALNDLGRQEEALKACEKALEIDPKNVDAWNNKGNALNDLGRQEEALKAFEKSLE
ncbi:MAG TPA: tetratricopeptide repeat protein, partial [Lachnospiraceae bacterium]|nr:tetratricopeptide repeat protein [Lachnospiraceae bacterium]